MNATLPDEDLKLRRLALAAVLLMLTVVAASAWLRLAQPRPACAEWPDCRLSTAAAAATAPPLFGHAGTLSAVRAVHRLSASALLPVAAWLAWRALARRPRNRRVAGHALAMLALALALAALGIVTPGSPSAAVLLGNLLGGQLLLALAWSALRGLDRLGAPTAATGRWALACAALWAAQAALGALSGAGRAPDAALAHLLLALPSLAVAGMLGVLTLRQGLSDARWLLGLVALQAALGAAGFVLAAPVALVLLHNASAALGLALLFGLGTARNDPN